MRVGDVLVMQIYGKDEKCEVLVVHPHGTVDVERLSDGKCFRVSGLGVAA